MKKLFSKRHYEWLAHFAGANMSITSARHLAEALVDTNDQYDMHKFLQTYHRVRNFVKAHDRMHEVAAAQDAPRLRAGEASADAYQEHLTHGEVELEGDAVPVCPPTRRRTCLSCGHTWTSPVRLSAHTYKLSGEATEYCPQCSTNNIMSEPMQPPPPPVAEPVEDAFDAHLRRHYDEAKAAGTDEIFYSHRCWKCDSGKKPCVTGNPSGCRYLYAVND